VILDLLGEYRELETPVNPDLLKIFIDNATDRLEAIYGGTDLLATDNKPVDGSANAPKAAPSKE
jgi:hypothetical protein